MGSINDGVARTCLDASRYLRGCGYSLVTLLESPVFVVGDRLDGRF